MALRIEDYALIGDTHTAGLVGIDGSIDWLCLPRFDAGACFSALLGTERHGRWLVAPRAGGRAVRRRYRPGTLILETDFETPDGAVRVIDLMPPRSGAPDVVRLVVGLRGRVAMQMQLILRFDYGGIVPWVREVDGGLCAVGGPDAVCLHTPVETRGEDLTTVAEFSVGEGERVPFVLTWFPSHEEAPAPTHAEEALTQTADWWRDWSGRSRYRGGWQEAVDRSLITLKALTYAPTGGIVAAATTSLPEWIGGVRNWDYRFCWLRDAAFTLYALSLGGYNDEARAWRDWLLRALAGDPPRLQALYGPAGERRLTEIELPWLPGYEDSSPVRIGNGAADQFQLDVYGETVDALHQGRLAGIDPKPAAWSMERLLVDFVEDHWQDPDEGIWEVRGPRRHFTHSKVMAWVAVDRSVRAVERFGLEGPVDQWRALRARIHEDVCRNGFDAERNTFTQSYGSRELDGSLLMIPLVRFLRPSDSRVAGTVEAIQRELCEDGFVLRYRTGGSQVDGLPGNEGAFLACTFWLVDNLALLGRLEEARDLFERLLTLRNDVGLLAEEYDPRAGRLLGNFPQAFSHVGLVNSAHNLSAALGLGTDAGPERS